MPRPAGALDVVNWSNIAPANNRACLAARPPPQTCRWCALTLNLTNEERFLVRDTLLKESGLIQQYVDANPYGDSAENLEIIRSWRNWVQGYFVVVRSLSRYTIFLSDSRPGIAYGVRGLTIPLDQMLSYNLPTPVEATLLPFRDKIVYDGFLRGYGTSVVVGAAFRRSINEEYRDAKARLGIVTSLPVVEQPAGRDEPARATSPRAKATRSKNPTAQAAQDAASIVGEMVDFFCAKHLNAEYAQLCAQLVDKLRRKRPSPLLRGKPEVWACAVVCAIGAVNFLGDPSQSPHMPTALIAEAFGISTKTANAKSLEIRKMMDMIQLDPEWTLPSLIDENPLVWMLNIDGFMMDIRHAPRELQEAAFQQGLIPYIPAEANSAT